MKILTVYIGNAKEVYIEKRLNCGVNVISSDDNNKGKTILIQGMMYALGNSPLFPSSFNYKDYYYITEIKNNNQNYRICRKNDNIFVLDYEKKLFIFDTVSDFKYYYNNTIHKLPKIIKDGKQKLVDLNLFYQIFFVGQDERTTSKIFKSGQYNKDDFINMIFSILLDDEIVINETEEEILNEINDLKEERKVLISSNKFLKSKSRAASFINYKNDKEKIDKKIMVADKIKDDIADLKKQRSTLISRKINTEILIKELRSLNRTIKDGKLVCLDCGSENIGFELADKSVVFDASDVDIRRDILKSLEEKISSMCDEINLTEIKLSSFQNQLKDYLDDKDVSLENIIFYKQEIAQSKDVDDRLKEIDKSIADLTAKLEVQKCSVSKRKNLNEEILEDIISDMNSFYKLIDPNGNLVFDNLFTSATEVFSGSEETEFYLSKIYALLKNLKHEFPIIIDSFREGELSTIKEKKILEKFSEFSNQIIFTATLKDEELGKYNFFEFINNIDYSINKDSKLLNEKNVPEFIAALHEFSIKI